MSDILLVLLFVTSAALFSIITTSLSLGISPMPISVKAKSHVMAHLPKLSPHSCIFELGSGWGGMAFSLAKYYSNQKIIALEKSLIPFYFSKIFRRKKNLIFLRKDLSEISLKNADLIFCYLFPKAMSVLEQRFEKELKVNCMVISNVFSLPTWKAETIYSVNDLYQSKIYVYRKASASALSTASIV